MRNGSENAYLRPPNPITLAPPLDDPSKGVFEKTIKPVIMPKPPKNLRPLNRDLQNLKLGEHEEKFNGRRKHQTIIEDDGSDSEGSSLGPTMKIVEGGIPAIHDNLVHFVKNRTSRTPPEMQSDKSKSSNPPSLNEFPMVKGAKIRRVQTGVDLQSGAFSSRPSSPNFRRENSMRSLRGGFYGHEGVNGNEWMLGKPASDAASIRSWASVGLGSTDGKKMIIRRVPTSPEELFQIVNPPTPPDDYLYDADSDDDADDDDDSSDIKPLRHKWANKFQFVLACVGYSVGLGSVWRFPYLCYKSGGGVFLIPYFMTMLICGVPLLYMELAVGQYTGRGPIGALGHLCPLFKGTGLGSVVISFLMSTYYSVIIAYAIFYFFTSFRSKLPWVDCSNKWNTKNCWIPPGFTGNTSKVPRPMNSQSPSEEFYDIKVLDIGKGIEDWDQIRWELVACLIFAWILVYFAIWKSIKSSGKTRYFTTTLPFLLILVFLGKSLTLDGSTKGLRYFFKPRWELLSESKVWVNAAAQTFNSMGLAFGSMICFASYNKYNNNILQDTLAVSFVNLITSLLVGIFAFATIGNIANEHNTSIEDVIADGPGLIFVVYPQAIAKMPATQLWAIMFFLMLLCLSLNSQFATVEVVVTSMQDGFPQWIKKHLLCHEILVLVICLISLLFGLPYVTRSGIYFFQLIDHYAATISKMYLAFFEVVAIAWIYGGGKLCQNVKTMTGKEPGLYFKFCWVIAMPLMILALWVFLLIDYAPPTYNNGYYHYPHWAIILGWIIASLSILCIPIYMVFMFIKAPGSSLWEKFRSSLQSDLMDKCPKCGDPVCDCPEEALRPMLVVESRNKMGVIQSSIKKGNAQGDNQAQINNIPLVNHTAPKINIETSKTNDSLSSQESKM